MPRTVTTLYGSQTGTAQDISEQIWRESKKFHFKGSVMAMDDYDVRKLIDEKVCVFVCSTTGQGDEPDNMKKFWKFLLRKSLPADSLSNLHFAVVGLGDSSYSKFNFVAKRIHKRLIQLGATPLQPAALCDDQHDLGIGFILFPWLELLWKCLLLLQPLPDDFKALEASPRQFRWQVSIGNFQDAGTKFFESLIDSTSDYMKVEDTKRTTTEDHFQDVRLVSLKAEKISWTPGDVAYVRAYNSAENIDKLFALFEEHNLNLYPELWVQILAVDDGNFF